MPISVQDVAERQLQKPGMPTIDLSIVVVSYNTREVLRECLECTLRETEGLSAEIVVVDNNSSDDSAVMVQQSFPGIKLLKSDTNLGFGSANNLGWEHCSGRYAVLINSDAFLHEGALRQSLKLMDEHPQVGLAGGRLVGRDMSWQPSARMFPSIFTDFFVLTGLSGRFPKSKIFGHFDRTWTDQSLPAEVDWVPGAFSIIRAELLKKIPLFDPEFFLYCEEVDLCRRVQEAGYSVWYWPQIVVTHIGGESSRQVTSLEMTAAGSQLTLWRMRSSLLYYRKHHGNKAWLAKIMETSLYRFIIFRNIFSNDPYRKQRVKTYQNLIKTMQQAWKDTRGGRISPPRPW